MTITVRLLGPLEVAVGGRPIELTAGRLRALVAVLALTPGRTVSLDHIAAAVWGPDIPANVRSTLQTYVTRLRNLLGPGTVGYGSNGYVLRVSPESVDCVRFVGLLETAATGPAERDVLAEALALWRGAPFQGVRSAWLEDMEAPRLVERFLAATERYADLTVAQGNSAVVLPRLLELTAQFPLRESLWARLLVALEGCGRPAEALSSYEVIRTRIADELGMDPGAELQAIYRRLLTRVTQDGYADAWAVVPHQLPADIDVFAGRSGALRALDRVRAPVVVVSGMAGVGKTTLVRHWGHRVLDRFPDGQLYANLRGYDSSRRPLAPTDVLYAFLGALGVPAARIPAAVEEQTALYVSVTSGRRFLVVLDNAVDADQVRPLLPGGGGLTVVTSRDQLAGLVAETGAHAVVLEPVPDEEARELLARRLGAEQVADEQAAVDEIIAVCAGLPLALAIVSTRARFPLRLLAGQLRQARTSLDELATGDDATDPRAVFSWSYDALPAETARLFRLLSLHPGPEVSVPAAAALAGLPRPQARRMLARLAGANLLSEHAPARYAFHDLLRVYAVELAALGETAADRAAATRRMLDHYLQTAYAADGVLDTRRTPIALLPAVSGVAAEKPADAMAWFDTEHPVLVAMIELADTAGYDTHTWQLAWSATDFLARRGHWQDWAATQRRALDAVTRLGDPPEQARAHRGLARAYTRLGRNDEAYVHLREALDLYTEVDDHNGLARTHQTIADVLDQMGRYREAQDHLERSREHCLAIDDQTGLARVLNALGWLNARLGRYAEALDLCEQALARCQALDYRSGEAGTWDSLGYIHHHSGRYGDAARCYREAIAAFRELGDRFHEAETLTRLGDTHFTAGNHPAARTAWSQAVDILDETHHPDAKELRVKLATLAC